MRNPKDSLYSYFGNFDFIELAKELDFNFIVEAGVHDGSDSANFLETFPDKQLYGFEPDIVAFEIAAKRLLVFHERAKISNIALSDKAGKISLIRSGAWGSGSTRVEISPQDSKVLDGVQQISCSRLDDLEKFQGTGILWLDVEGHAMSVLRGAKNSLDSIIAAKIEVQMHDMYGMRRRDAWHVIKILKPYALIPLRLPIYPGFFGDILFIRKEKLSVSQRFQSKFFRLIFLFLHKFVYRILRLPKNIWV